MMSRLRSSGGALISALFITAISAMIATALAVQVQLLIHAARLASGADHRYLDLQLMQWVARQRIADYAAQWIMSSPAGKPPTSAVPKNITPLNPKLPNITLEDDALSGVISDEQGKYNLNNLIHTENQAQFATLLRAVIPDVDQQVAIAIAKSITAWMTDGADNAYYLSQQPPYQSSQRQLTNITELRLIAGVTPRIYAALTPYVTALPVPKPVKKNLLQQSSPQAPPTQQQAKVLAVNINSVSKQVLIATNPTLTPEQAESLVSCRLRFGGAVNSLSQFITTCAQPLGISQLNNLDVKSSYFLVQSQLVSTGHHWDLNSLVVTRQRKNNTLSVDIVWQSFE